MTLQVDVEATPQGVDVRLSGELEADSRDEFLTAVQGRTGDVFLDASSLTFVDSSGLAAMVIAAERARGQGRRFTVVAMSEPVRSLLTRTGLLAHLTGAEDQAGR